MNEITYAIGASNGGEVTPEDEKAGKVLGHFTDSLFLNNVNYPEAGFTILSSDENGVDGELTFAGSTLSIVIPGTPTIEEGKLSHEAEFDLDLSTASAYLTESGWKIRMNLSLIATK
jgi:polyisoprenoid-binding protein YceI